MFTPDEHLIRKKPFKDDFDDDDETGGIRKVARRQSEDESADDSCVHPEYLVFTWVLCLIALATTLKLYFLVKTFLASVMVAVYTGLTSLAYPQVFTQNDTDNKTMPLSSQMMLLLIVFLVLVAYHARLVEVTSRLDFLWKRDAERELTEMRETRTNNRQLLRNILPDHVAHHFLSSSRRHTTDVSLFARSSLIRSNICLIFFFFFFKSSFLQSLNVYECVRYVRMQFASYNNTSPLKNNPS